MGKVKVAIAGVGNCANSLIQGVTYYADADANARVPGLMHVGFGGYHIRDIELVAASTSTPPRWASISKAMWASMNDTYRFAEVPVGH